MTPPVARRFAGLTVPQLRGEHERRRAAYVAEYASFVSTWAAHCGAAPATFKGHLKALLGAALDQAEANHALLLAEALEELIRRRDETRTEVDG